MLIVEQSLNIAAAIADRAVFMEKGAVRYVGPARELLERDDLARAVFLGRDDA
jgi:ABC-type branched-subunit amino acid transport system ATPase component